MTAATPPAAPIPDQGRLPFRESGSYRIGAVGSNVIYALVATYLMVFYTESRGLKLAAAGWLLLRVRVWDGFMDVLMGIGVDNTRTRWGRSRPYLLFGCVLTGMATTACFITPDFSAAGKLGYAYGTYILWSVSYNLCDIPFWSLTPAMTDDPDERTRVVSFFRTGAQVGYWLVYVGALPVGIYRVARMAGDRGLRAQALKMFKARSIFRFPGVDSEGFKVMTSAAPIGTRNNHLPGHNVYLTRDLSITGASVVAYEDDKGLLGCFQQQLGDGQLHAMINDDINRKNGGLGAPLFPDELESALSKAKGNLAMPTDTSAPDFAWGDEENMVVGAKHGDETTGPYTMKLPAGFPAGTDLVSGKPLKAPVVIPKGTTVVFHLEKPASIKSNP